MDDINEQTEKMRQVQEALGQPVGYAADLDEDELEEELAALEAEDLEDELDLEAELAAPAPKVAVRPQPATAASAPAMPSAPVGRAPAPKLPSVPGKSSEDEELEAPSGRWSSSGRTRREWGGSVRGVTSCKRVRCRPGVSASRCLMTSSMASEKKCFVA